VDAGDAAVVGDADDVGGLAVPREDAVAQLGGETLASALTQVEVFGEPLFELDAAALAFPALDGALEDGPVGAHANR
jgi:hypothetical protein